MGKWQGHPLPVLRNARVHEASTADIAVWGRIPPPVGGMAVHLKRLLPYLNQAGISTQMYSVGRRTPDHPDVKQVSEHRLAWLLGLLFGPCEPLHYVFSDRTSARFGASLLVLRGVKVVLRIGGDSLARAASSRSVIERCMIRFAMRRVSAVVGVSEQICSLARQLGAKRVIHAPGFIPEVCESNTLPDEVASFLNARTGPVLLASGEARDRGEEDLYGAYALLDVLDRLPDVRLVFYAYRISLGETPQKHLSEEIRRRGLQSRCLLFCSTTDLLPAMLNCDVMVRPTLSDGDSNSIREALHLGLPVIASDCVKRPDGVVTFPTGDLAGLQDAIARVLNDLDRHRQHVRSLPKASNATPIVELFRDLLGFDSRPCE
jgi:glycosyltransferase involved in cell wall biosynthesis